MQLQGNGKAQDLDDASTIADLLLRFDLPPIRVAIELNRELVPRNEFDKTALHDGDNVEIVTFVGGG